MADELKASISLANLKHALKITGMANGKANIVPIMQGVRMEQISTGLALEATDLDIHIRVVLPELGGPQRPIITPAEKFHAWAKLLDGQDVSITEKQNGRAEVRCGRAKAVLPLYPPANWPTNEIYCLEGDPMTLTQGTFARALTFAQISVGDGVQKGFSLDGIQVQGDGTKLQVVSTEGHCLTCYTVPFNEKINLLLPSRFVKVLLPLLTDEDGGVDLVFNDQQILASIDADTKLYIGCPRMAARFPTWESMIPKDARTDVKVKISDLSQSLERCALLTDEKSGAIDLAFADNVLTIHAANAQHGEADETVPYEGALRAEFKTRLNADFLRSLVRKLSDELTIAIPSSNEKAMFFKAEPHKDETLSYVVMPMRM